MSPEKSQKVCFEGFVIDLFLCDSGNLGLTIEKGPESETNPAIDIFVDGDTLQVTGETHGSHGLLLLKAEALRNELQKIEADLEYFGIAQS